MKLDYFKGCVIGTELKLDLFLERNRGLMYSLTADVLQGFVNQKAVVLYFAIEGKSYIECRISLHLLVDGEFHKREIGLSCP